MIDAYMGNGVYAMQDPYERTMYFIRVCDDGEFAVDPTPFAIEFCEARGYKIIDAPERFKRFKRLRG